MFLDFNDVNGFTIFTMADYFKKLLQILNINPT